MMQSRKIYLKLMSMLLIVVLLLAQGAPAFAEEVSSNTQLPIQESDNSGLGNSDDSGKCVCPTAESSTITHLEECPFYDATVKECSCTKKCIPADSESGVNAVVDPECRVCGTADADLSLCKGAAVPQTEDSAPELSLEDAAPVSLEAAGDIAIDETNFPDAKFREWLKKSENINGVGSDGILTPEEISGITLIYMSRQGIRDLTGIERFASLTHLMCAYNYNPFTVPKGLPSSLKALYVMESDLTMLPALPSGLEVLNCSGNKLTELPTLPNTLKALDCSKNTLTELNLTGLDLLNTSSITGFNATGQTAYIALLEDGAGGFEADIALSNPTFESAGISYEGGKLKSNSSAITETSFTIETGKTGATLSGTLHLSYPVVGSIEINDANFPDAKLRSILKSPDIWIGIKGVGKDGYLTTDEVTGITSLDLRNQGIRDFTGIALFTALESLDCSQNALSSLPELPGSLKILLCYNNNLTAFPVLPSSLERLYCSDNNFTTFPILPDGLLGLDCSYNPLNAPPILPDGLLWLSYAGIGPALLPAALPASLEELNYSDNGLTVLPNLPGGLASLDCSGNNLTSLDLSGLTSLYDLDCSGNRLSALDVSSPGTLEMIYCAGNMLTTLDMSAFRALEVLDCSANWLAELNLTGLGNLELLNCAGNQLDTLNVSGLSDLRKLNCSGNLLTALNLSDFSTVGYFDLQADDQTPRITLSGSDTAGYSTAILLNNPSGLASSISYVGGVLKSTGKGITSTPFSVGTGLEGKSLSGTLILTYENDSLPVITTTSLQRGTVNAAYSQILAATGSTPITWSIDSGALPNGLSLSNNTISGTPTIIGTFSFTVKAENSMGQNTKALSIVISPAYGTGGGGSSGSVSSSSDGTIVITVPEKDSDQPVMAGFSVVPTVGRNGHAAVIIPQKSVTDAITKALAAAKAQGKTENGIGISITLSNPANTNSFGIVLPQAVLKQLTGASVQQLKVDGKILTLNFNQEALLPIQTQSTGDVTITVTPVNVKEVRNAYDITISFVKDGKIVNITSLGNSNVTLSIPYTPARGETAGGLYAVYVDGEGNAARIPGSAFNANSKSVIFTANHFSVYGVGYTAPSTKFTDISGHWAQESIDYVVGRGLFSGTSNTTFSPNEAMTRGMLVTALGRMASVNASGYKTSSFTDVNSGSTFEPYIEWAYQNGVIQGIGNRQFAPDRAITREEIAVILANYAKANGYTLPVTCEATGYADSASIGREYKTAVTAMQQAGIMMGGQDNKFNPKAGATRAEVSTMLQRYEVGQNGLGKIK